MRERSTISVGQSAKNTFSIPLENLPRQFDLFSVENDHYRLNFTDQMDGRISDGAQPLRLSELKAKGENRGEFWSVPISALGGFRNSSGSSGTTFPSSAACAR